jgi:hypothetical protein
MSVLSAYRNGISAFTASAPDSTDCENTNQKSLKIRIYPEPKLHQIWKKWLAATKYYYNQGIAYLRESSRETLPRGYSPVARFREYSDRDNN